MSGWITVLIGVNVARIHWSVPIKELVGAFLDVGECETLAIAINLPAVTLQRDAIAPVAEKVFGPGELRDVFCEQRHEVHAIELRWRFAARELQRRGSEIESFCPCSCRARRGSDPF